jgi:hypothetical protein
MNNEKTAVEWLAEKYNYITWMRNRDEISAGMADEWRKHYLDQAKQMEKEQAERMYSEAIEFAEWIRIKDFQTTSKDNWIGLDMKYYTTEELFEQFKKK